MSEITANIVVQSFGVDITVESPEISFTPEVIGMTVSTGGFTGAGGNVTQLQFNNGGILGGVPTATYNGNSVVFAGISTIKITGGSSGQAIVTDGTGNLSFANVDAANTANTANYANFSGNANIANTATNANFANYAGNVTVSSQPNITSTGTLTGLNVSGNASFTGANVSLGNVGNVKITGGTSGYYLQTDGTGNLNWVVGGGSGNGVVGGTNTQIQFNDAGLFGGTANLTFNKTTNVLTLTGNLVTNNANLGNAATANYFVGNLFGVANSATIANTANTLSGKIDPLTYGIENVSIITAQTGTYNFDLISNAIRYSTGTATGNLTVNFRGNSTTTLTSLLGVGESITGTYVMTTGSTPYGVTGLQIDGSNQTIRWSGLSANLTPTQYSNTIVSYTFTMIKTSASPAYTVFGSATRYG